MKVQRRFYERLLTFLLVLVMAVTMVSDPLSILAGKSGEDGVALAAEAAKQGYTIKVVGKDAKGQTVENLEGYYTLKVFGKGKNEVTPDASTKEYQLDFDADEYTYTLAGDYFEAQEGEPLPKPDEGSKEIKLEVKELYAVYNFNVTSKYDLSDPVITVTETGAPGDTTEEKQPDGYHLLVGKSYKYTVTAKNYKEASNTIEVTTVGQQPNKEVSLEPETQNITFTVTGYKGEALEGAKITITPDHEPKNPITLTTDDQGKATFNAEKPETYSYIVTLDGYNTYDNGSFKGSENSVSVSLQLSDFTVQREGETSAEVKAGESVKLNIENPVGGVTYNWSVTEGADVATVEPVGDTHSAAVKFNGFTDTTEKKHVVVTVTADDESATGSIAFNVSRQERTLTFDKNWIAQDDLDKGNKAWDSSSNTLTITYDAAVENNNFSLADDLTSIIDGYDSANDSFACAFKPEGIVNFEGKKFTVTKLGETEATITVKDSTGVYQDATVTIKIRVEKEVKASDLTWDEATVTYEGKQAVYEMTGTFTAYGDMLTVKAQVRPAEKDVQVEGNAGEYTQVKIIEVNPQQVNDGIKDYLTFDAAGAVKDDAFVAANLTINPAELKVKPKESSYSHAKDLPGEIDKYIESRSGQVTYADGEEQKVTAYGDEKEVNEFLSGLKLKVEKPENEYDSGEKYAKAIIPDLDGKTLPNYNVVIDEANGKADLAITQYDIANESLDSLVTVSGVHLYQDNSTYWLKASEDADGAYLQIKPFGARAEEYENVILTGEGAEDGIDVAHNKFFYNGEQKNAEYKFYLQDGTNENSRTSEHTITIKIDGAAPVVTFAKGSAKEVDDKGGSIFFGMFSKQEYTLSFDIKDEGSGIKTSEYHVVKLTSDLMKDDGSVDVGKLLTYCSGLHANGDPMQGWATCADLQKGEAAIPNVEDASYLLLVKTSDQVDNAVICASNGIIIDVTDPSVVINGLNSDQVYGTDEISYSVEASDGTASSSGVDLGVSSVEKVEVQVKVNGETKYNETFYANPETGEFQNKEYTELIAAKVMTYTQDLTLPSSEDDKNQDYNSNDVEIVATAYDRAGNSLTTSQRIKIDRTNPKVDITFDKNSPANGKYYNAERTATVVFTERNFDETKATFDLTVENDNGKETYTGFTLDELNAIDGITAAWGQDSEAENADTAFTDKRTVTATVTFSGDGTYTGFTAHCEDLAENSGDSTEQAEFVIDQTAPVVGVKYYVNGQPIEVGSTESARFYTKETVQAVIEIKEANFISGNSFVDDQMQYTLTATKSAGKVKDFQAIVNDPETWTIGSSYSNQTNSCELVFDEDANYTIDELVYTDLAGNTVVLSGSKDYFTVDKTKPTGSIVIQDKGVWRKFYDAITFNLFSKDSLEVQITQEDATSPLEPIQYHTSYSILTLDALKALAPEEWTTADHFPVDPNEQLIPYAKLTDAAGNVEYLSTDTYVIVDNQAESPVITITAPQPAHGIYNGDVPFQISVEDPIVGETYSGLASVKWEVLKDNVVTQSGEYTYPAGDRQRTMKADLTVKAADNNSNNVTIRVHSTDNSGNEAEKTLDLKIDVTKPTINITFDNNSPANGKYYKDVRTATVVFTERNFDAEKATFDLTLDNGEKKTYTGVTLEKLNEINGVTAAWGKDSEAGKADIQLSDERTVTATVTFSGDYTYTGFIAHCEDLAVNSGDSAEQVEFVVDRTAPVVGVKYYVNGQPIEAGSAESARFYTNQTVQAVVEIKEANFISGSSFVDGQMKYTLTATDSADQAQTVKDYQAIVNDPATWNIGSSYNNPNNSCVLVFDADANYTIDELVYTDLAGNTVPLLGSKDYFTVDKTNPTGSIEITGKGVWNKFFNAITFEMFSKDMLAVRITQEDATSPLEPIQYYKSDKTLSEAEVRALADWTTGDNFSVSPNEQFIPYAKLTDKAGNVSYLSSDAYTVVDNRADSPVITITAPQPANGIYNGNVPFRISVEDPIVGNTYSGLASVKWEVLKDNVVTQSGEYTYPAGDRQRTMTADLSVDAAANNSNSVTIRVHSTDNSGNEAEKTLDLKIDVTKPTISITFDNNAPANGQYYKDVRTATVVVTERNFDESAFRFTITNTDGTQPSISGWTHSANAGVSDEATHTCTVTYSADGDYTMAASCNDLAGNGSDTATVTDFTIDRTLPVITVAYNARGSKVDGYLNQHQIATISINEHNFNAADVQSVITAMLDGAEISAPSIVGWTRQGDVYTATVSYLADGDYTFTISYTDLAGNAAAAYETDRFTVDTTVPEVDIDLPTDGSGNVRTAYGNEEVAPRILLTDVNYDAEDIQVSLLNMRNPNQEVDVSKSILETANGLIYSFDDFPYTKAMDGLYVLTVTTRDLAGNETVKEITFSVNRFGAYYILSDETRTLVDGYYTNKEQDVVIREYSFSQILDSESSVYYTRDGETVNLEQNAGYTRDTEVTPDLDVNVYTYTMDAENFAQEGYYDVAVESTDVTGNQMTNKLNQYSDDDALYNAEIDFIVDKTNPSVSINNLDDETYNESKHEATAVVTDNIAVARVEVYVAEEDLVGDGSIETAVEPIAVYTTGSETEEDTITPLHGEIPVVISESNNHQIVKAIATDVAGNLMATEQYRVLVTSNRFVQFYNNTPLFIGSITLLAALIALVIILIAKKRKKETKS